MPLRRRHNPHRTAGRMPLLKKLFWAYFLLLIFEGALRKWIVPQLSTPLLLVRDPVGMMIIWEAYRTQKWPARWSMVTGALTAGLVGLCVVQIVAGGNPWFVGLYGLRSYLLPFPVAFIMGENLDAEDLRKFGICTLWLLLPLTLLEIVQYNAPPSSLLNAGAYEGAGQIGYVSGHVRASGTFSFATGPIGYLPLAAAFTFYGLVNEKFAKKWLLWAAMGALILSIPVIGSRTIAYELAAILACMGIGALFGVSQFVRSLKLIAPMLVVAYLVSLLPVFSEASNSMTQRFTQATEEEGGVEQSFLGRTLYPVTSSVEMAESTNNWIGHGMGQGAAAMARILTGAPAFTAGEGEINREVYELGPLMGVTFALFRLLLGLTILGKAFSRMRDREPLALLLVPALLSTLWLGVLEQATDQGFMVISLAFALAATKFTGVVVASPPGAKRVATIKNRSDQGRNTRSVEEI